MRRRDFIAGLAGTALGTTLAGCGFERLISDRPEANAGALRALRVAHDLCIGCRFCEEACYEVNVATGRNGRPLIEVHSFPGPYHVAWACLGCPDVPCVAACDYFADPLAHRKALRIDAASGAIRLDRQACAGCERCIEACERDGGGVLRWDDREYIAGGCHLCDGVPACAPACPVGAIALVDVDRDGTFAPRTIAETAREGIARVRGLDLDPDLERRPLRALRVDHDRCIGCRLCEIACDERNSAREVGGRRIAGPGDTRRSLIRVHPFEGPYYVAWACLGCPDVPCVAACQVESFGRGQHAALHVSPETGAIALDREFCTGCERCIDACRDLGGDVLAWDPVEKVVGACHHCHGDDEPACVRECPVEAIRLVEVDRNETLDLRRPADAARAGVERLARG